MLACQYPNLLEVQGKAKRISIWIFSEKISDLIQNSFGSLERSRGEDYHKGPEGLYKRTLKPSLRALNVELDHQSIFFNTWAGAYRAIRFLYRLAGCAGLTLTGLHRTGSLGVGAP